MITFHIRIIDERAFDNAFYCLVRISLNAAEQHDTCLAKSCLRSAADISADEGVNFQGIRKTCKSSMTTSHEIYDLAWYDLFIINILKLKFLGISETQEILSVFISYCNSQFYFPFYLSERFFRDACSIRHNRTLFLPRRIEYSHRPQYGYQLLQLKLLQFWLSRSYKSIEL